MVLELLYRLAEWHTLAKLRMHTDTTLGFFDTATAALGSALRKFQKDTCSAYDTRETPREEAARGRRKAAQAQASALNAEVIGPTVAVAGAGSIIDAAVTATASGFNPVVGPGTGSDNTSVLSSVANGEPIPSAPTIPTKRPRSKSPPRKAPYQGKKKKTFNMNTYKGHSLGHYASTIRRFGTTDSYSTQPVCIFII